MTAILLLAGVHVHAVPVQSPADQPRVDSDSAIAVEGCSALPNYNNATNIAGPWNIRTSRCRNGNDSQESCEIEGLAAGCDVTRSADEKGIERGSLTIVNNSPDTKNANTLLRCNGALHTFEAYVPSGAGALDWHAIGINKDPSTGQMEWGLGSQHSHPIQVYRQYIGSSPSGLILGSQGQTTWAARHSGSGLSSFNHKPFWFLRLLDSETAQWEDEYETHVRIDGS